MSSVQPLLSVQRTFLINLLSTMSFITQTRLARNLSSRGHELPFVQAFKAKPAEPGDATKPVRGKKNSILPFTGQVGETSSWPESPRALLVQVAWLSVSETHQNHAKERRSRLAERV
jgi:hypothetical protein